MEYMEESLSSESGCLSDIESGKETVIDTKSDVSWIARYKSRHKCQPTIKTYKPHHHDHVSPFGLNIWTPCESSIQNKRRASEESSPLLGLSIPGEKDTATALPHRHRTADTTALNPRTLHLRHAQGESASPGTSAPFSISTVCSPQNLQTNQGGENSQPHSISVSSSSTLHFICMHRENAAVASSYSVDRTHKILGQEKRQGERHETSPSAFRGLVSGPSTVVRPRKSVLKRIFDDMSYSESDNEGEKENNADGRGQFLQPRQLFPDDEDNFDREDPKRLRTTSSTKESAQRRGNIRSCNDWSKKLPSEQLSEEETQTVDVYGTESHPNTDYETDQPATAVSTQLQGLGVNLNTHWNERKLQVQQLCDGALKLSHKCISHLWTEDRNLRGEIMKEFKQQINSELTVLEREVAEWNNIETKAQATLQTQLTMLHDKRQTLQERVKTLKKRYEEFRLEIHKAQGTSHETQRNLESKMKQDMEQLKAKILLDMQHQQLQRLKGSLQKRFFR